MGAGRLKTSNVDRGFGFIADHGGADMSLHINELKTAEIDSDRIELGDRLPFETIGSRDEKSKARHARMAR